MEVKKLPVIVRDKIAEYKGKESYVCGNSDYSIEFDLDAEWDAYETKTARFIKDDRSYQDQVFSGNVCPVPIISDTYKIYVGVFAGELHTTTSAYIPAKKSVLCGSGLPADPVPDVYAQIMEHLRQVEQNGVTDEQIAKAINDYLAENPIEGVTPEEVGAAIEAYMREHPVEVKETDPNVYAWAKQPEKPKYTAEEVGAQPKGDYALVSEIPAPYELPVASADTLGGVKVGEGLQMTGGVLGVKPEGVYELIETITLEEEAMAIVKDITGYEKIKIWLEIPLADANKAGVIFVNSTPIVYASKMAENGKGRQFSIEVLLRNGCVFICEYGGGPLGNSALMYSGEVVPYPIGIKGLEADSIKKVEARMLQENVYPIGTKLELSGVRADA